MHIIRNVEEQLAKGQQPSERPDTGMKLCDKIEHLQAEDKIPAQRERSSEEQDGTGSTWKCHGQGYRRSKV